MFLFKFFVAIVLVEAITEVVVKSEIFYSLRKYFFEHKKIYLFNWLYMLTDCGYCFSVWVGWFIAIVFFNDLCFINKYIDWFFVGLFLHRLSNMFHYVIDFFRNWSDNGQGH